jgi:hypothetical protein
VIAALPAAMSAAVAAAVKRYSICVVVGASSATCSGVTHASADLLTEFANPTTVSVGSPGTEIRSPTSIGPGSPGR